MFIRARLRNKHNLWGMSIFFVVLAVIVSQCFSLQKAIAVNSSADTIKKTKLIVIDPGHGGVDPGAVGVGNVQEKDINLEISMCLRDILMANGYEVLMTRDSDIAINDERYHNIAKIKSSDLKNRLKIIESNPNAMALSIHQNHYPAESSFGAQMFYGRKNERSKLLAQAIQDAFAENLQPNNKRQIKKSTSSVYIVNNAKNPIVLVECGFISNYQEAAKLLNEDYQKQVAFTIFCGIVDYQNIMVTK